MLDNKAKLKRKAQKLLDNNGNEYLAQLDAILEVGDKLEELTGAIKSHDSPLVELNLKQTDTHLQEILAELKKKEQPEEVTYYIDRETRNKLRGEDGYTPKKGVDYFDGYTPIKGVDYFDGKDGSIIERDEIVRKINAGDINALKIQASQITGLPEFTREVVREVGMGFVETPLKAGSGIAISKDASGANVISSTSSGGGTWGSITGTLSNQTDLQTALNAKQNAITTGTTAQYFRGDLSLATFPTNVSSFTNDSGYLTSVGTGVANQITYWSGTNTLGSLTTATYPSLTELSYVKGVTSAIQTQFTGKASLALDNLASVAINTSLLLGTSDGGALGSTTKMWSDLFLASGAVINWNNGDLALTHSSNLLTLTGGNMNVVGTLSADRIGISSLKAVFGERYATFNEFNDVLWRADKRFTVTSSNGYSVATLFRGGFENTYTIPVSTTEVININLANQSGVPAIGVTYPEGKFYVHFYYINNNYSTISARTKMNGVWYALPTPTDISTVAGDKVLEFTVSSNNYLTDIELTITTNGSDSILVTALNYICDRWTAELELPYFDKFATTNSIMGNTRFRTVAQTTSANINADGDWYMGVGGTGGHFGIGTSTPGAYHLNVVGNILGNSIYTNSGEIFGSLGIAYLRGAGSNGVFINDSGAGDVYIAGGGGKVGIGQQYPTNRLHVKNTVATASANLINIDGGATGFSGSNDAGTAYSLIFSGCAYQTSIVQVIGAKIQMAKENTWNYADTPTGTKGSLIFYTSAGTPNSPTLTEGMRIDSAQKTTFNGVARLKGYTVATLPTGVIGDMAYVTDGDAGLAWGATVINSGAGATKYQVWYNNANWTITGK